MTSTDLARCLTAFVTAIACITPALGQETTEVQRRELRRAIDRSPSVLVDPAIIQRSPEPLSDASSRVAPALETPPAADTSAGASSPGAAAPASAVTFQPSVAVLAADATVLNRRLRRGELAAVKLDPAGETTAKEVLNQTVAKTTPAQVATLQSFEGAVMQLAEDNTEVQLKSYVLVGQPLQYSAETQQFVGTVLVGAADLLGDAASRTLAVPLVFEVLESALAEPSRVELNHTSPPYERIRVASRVRNQPVTITIASNFTRNGVTVLVPVEPALLVDFDGGDLRAWGMQAARVTISAVGIKPIKGTPVQISAPGAFLTDPDPPAFDENGIARATLRTDSAGVVTVSAAASQFAPGTKNINVIVPWFTLLVVCIGGLVGGLLHLVGKASGRLTTRRITLSLGVSALLGLVIFGLYVVGVRSLPVDFKVQVGDTFAFVVAALAGWLGAAFIKRRLVAAA